MRRLGWAFAAAAPIAAWLALDGLLAPTPPRSDLAGFSILAVALWSTYLAASLLGPRGWWTWAFPSAWAGLATATLFLAYRETFRAELAHFGPAELGWQVALHALVAPIEVFFGFAVGFLDPQGAAVVLACLALSLLGGEILRRRLWPHQSASAHPRAQER